MFKRQPSSREAFAETGDVKRLLKLLARGDAATRRSAILALGRLKSREAVGPIVAVLEDEVVRASAVQALAMIGDEQAARALILLSQRVGLAEHDEIMRVVAALPRSQLLHLLEDGDVYERVATISMLASLNERQAVGPLIRALDDRYSQVKTAAAEALGQLGEACAVDGLVKALDGPYELKAAAAAALGKLGDRRAIDELARHADWGPEEVRLAATTAIVALADFRSAPILVGLLDSSSYSPDSVKKVAVQALKQMGVAASNALLEAVRNGNHSRETLELLAPLAPAIAPELVSVLIGQERGLYASDLLMAIWDEKVATAVSAALDSIETLDFAVDVFIKIGQPALPQLIQALRHPHVPGHDRERIISALAKIGQEAAVPALIEALGDGGSVSRSAIMALAALGDERAVPALIEALGDGGSVSRSAIMALAALGDKRAIVPLVAELRNDDWTVCRDAADTLTTLGWKPGNPEERANQAVAAADWERAVSQGDAAVAPLRSALECDDVTVRRGAVLALGRLGDVAPLQLVLRNENEDIFVRRHAARALHAVGWNPVSQQDLDTFHELISGWVAWVAALRNGALDGLKMPQTAEEELCEAARIFRYEGNAQAAANLVRLLERGTVVQNAIKEVGLELAQPALITWLASVSIVDLEGFKEVYKKTHSDDLGTSDEAIEAAARMLGEIGDARAVRSLIELARMKKAGPAVAALCRILERDAANVSESDLGEVSGLAGVQGQWHPRTVESGDTYYQVRQYEEAKVDCSKVIRLAADELARRAG